MPLVFTRQSFEENVNRIEEILGTRCFRKEGRQISKNMNVPPNFAVRFDSLRMSHELRLETGNFDDGPFWMVRYTVYARNQAIIRGGWGLFRDENPINEEDIVLFEYIDNQNPRKMKVHILQPDGDSATLLLERLEAEENVEQLVPADLEDAVDGLLALNDQ
ncbi:hypothetical protein Tsubulata_037759 [Turnera subulata]|uniref:TF-B3 domain-containing protein n=1 Tax=Turnera subulata TaxID=218843 RepID=A0A9Q0F8P5_9ROSI|nr:hypothetical protein Tsubulata_037759 [Turnera subulata]